MAKITISSIIKTSIVTAFTIATALIWKDVITEIITMFVPAEEQLLYKFIVAVIATIIIVIIIFVILEAQAETEVVWRRFRNRKKIKELNEKKTKRKLKRKNEI